MERINVIQSVSQNLRDQILDAKPSSLTGSSAKFDELIQPNARQIQGKYAYIYAGGGAGQSRICGTINPTTREILFTQGFGTVPSLNSDFLITDFFAKSEYDNAMNRAIGIARTKNLVDKVATMELVATQYEYAVPSGFEWISSLQLVPTSSTDYAASDIVNRIFEIPPRDFRISRNAVGSYIIVIDPRKINLDAYDTHYVNVIGQVLPDVAATDNATIPVDLEEYVIAYSSMLLSSQRMNENKEWASKFYMFRDTVRPMEDYIFRYGRGRKVK